MAVSSFKRIAAASSTSVGSNINLSVSQAGVWFSYAGIIKAGGYEIVKTDANASIYVYVYNGTNLLVSQTGNVANGTVITIPEDGDNLIWLSDSVGTITLNFSGVVASNSATLGAISSVTTSGPVTLTSPSIVMCLGGGSAGRSNYGGGNAASGGTTSIGGISAGGGSASGGDMFVGGNGGSGGGGGGIYSPGGNGGSGGSNGSNGSRGNQSVAQGGSGSGDPLDSGVYSSFNVTPGNGGSSFGNSETIHATNYGGGGGGRSTSANTYGQGGGLYAGGGGSNASGNNGANGGGGGGSGYLALGQLGAGTHQAVIGAGGSGTSTYSGDGYQGAIWFREVS